MKMSRKLLILPFTFVSIGALAAGIPEVKNTDSFTMGRGANGDDKEFTFNIGDGATNPKLLINDTLKLFNFNKGLDVTGAGTFSGVLSTGNGTNQDLNINFDMNGTADVPGFKYDSTAGELLFKSKVGANFKKFGSGSGGGGGEGYNNAFTSDDNANAEDGTAGWTNSGGTFTTSLVDPLEGEQSFEFTPSAQNDYVRGPLLNMNQSIFKGRACQAQIEYIGGDENLELRILDLSGAVYKSETLKAHTISAAESVFFLCPSTTEIAGDANLAQLRIEIFNAGASASPLIKFDKSYLGTLIGLSESVLPDVSSASFKESLILSQSGDGVVDSIVYAGASSYTAVTFKAGTYSETPVVNCQVDVGNSGGLGGRSVEVYDRAPSSFKFIITNSGGSTTNGYTVDCFFQKQGADAKQAVQVYKSIPKVSENVNDLTSSFASNAALLGFNADWIQSATNNGGGNYTVNFKSGVFSTAPACHCEADVVPYVCTHSAGTASSISLAMGRNDNGTVVDSAFSLKCSKQGSDFKMPTVQPILVNQVETGVVSGIRVESCTIDAQSGTPLFGGDPRLCQHWITSLGDFGIGNVRVNIAAGVFNADPSCVCTTGQNIVSCNTQTTDNKDWFDVSTYYTNAVTTVDTQFTVNCTGIR